ncbi:MAG TPA: hypothetical protein VF176_03555 [Solirubrobacterales bacterium]
MAVALAAMFVGLVLAPTASATSDPLASGTTNLYLKKGFKTKLSNNDVSIKKWGSGAVRNKSVVDLPVSGGSMDPTTGQGTVDTGGGFKFKHRKRAVPVTEMEIDTTRKSVFAKVAGAKMKFGFLAGTASFFRNGFGVDVKSTQVKLTGKAAKRINSKLGLADEKPFKGGNVMSNSYSATQPSTVTILPTNSATLAGNVGTLGKFATKGINPFTQITAIAPASKPTVTSFNLPISGGTVAPDLSSGTLNTSGGVQIEKTAGATMQLTNIGIDLGTKVALTDLTILPTPGNAGRASIADIVMTGATVVIDPATRTFTVSGAVANVQAVAAATLNTTFPGGTDFVAGDPFGTFSFVAQAQ